MAVLWSPECPVHPGRLSVVRIGSLPATHRLMLSSMAPADGSDEEASDRASFLSSASDPVIPPQSPRRTPPLLV